MAKEKPLNKASQLLLDKFLSQASELWHKHHGKFEAALDESDRKKIKLHFDCDLDLSESAPVVDTEISFKDKTTESGMNVIKTFRAGTRAQMEDPNQLPLPGTQEAEEAEARKADEAADAAAEPKKKRGKKAGKEAAAGD